MKELDEKGFVFLDEKNRPYKCCIWNKHPWLFYWHPDNHWVSLREVSQSDIWGYPRNLSQEAQDLYDKSHDEYNNQIQTDAKKTRASQLNVMLRKAECK